MARELFEDDAKSDFAKKKKKKRKKNDDDDENDDVAEQIARAKLESSRRAKFVNAAENELCEPSREGPEVNFPSSKEEYEELRQRRKSVDANLAEHDHQKKDDEDEDVMKNKEWERKEKEEKAITKWVQSYDKTQQNFYYFNPITRETTWEAPNDENAKIVKDESAVAEHKKRTLLASVSKEELEEIEREVRGKMGADDKNDNERLPDPSTSAAPQMVWEYEDDSGNWQGPFTMEQLQTWRAALPMNLKVRQCGNTNASEYTSLAILLGDVHLRKKCEELGAVLPLRCTAVEAEQVMMAAIAARDRIVKENLNGLASDHDNDDDAEEEGEANENNNVATQNPNRWAQAALEGLPESDRLEQEKMTAENAMGVRSAPIAQNVNDQEDASERFASVGTYNKVTGRVTAEVNELLQRRRAAGPPGGAGAAYRNIGLENYIDPAKMDEAMKEIQKARHQKLSRAEIEKRKARKKEMKKKHGDNWLREEWAD